MTSSFFCSGERAVMVMGGFFAELVPDDLNKLNSRWSSMGAVGAS